ncbi:MAG: amino acid ABC transporter permease [Lachnospiraceae bacterium]|nr:amino acid ABC transporter permease [Lachnospiraceae bacterium]
MDTGVISKYIPIFAKAFLLTLKTGWLGVLLAFLLGIAGAFVLYFKFPLLSAVIKCYVELFRNTPLLVQLFFIYYGLPALGIRTSAEFCGVLGLGLLGGSYMTESIRSGLEAVPQIQKESAVSLGFTKKQIFLDIILPQAFTISIPGLIANVIFLLKETSVFSAISLMDLMFTAKDLIGLYYDTTESLFLLVVFYILMLLPVSFAGSIIEKKTRFKMFGD